VIEISSDEGDPTYPAPKSKLKGKAKVRGNDSEPILRLEGAEQCQSCVKKELPCMINLASIDRWERQVNAGELPMKIPTAGVGCLECCERGLSCILPQMKAFRKTAPAEGKRKPDASKKPQLVEDVDTDDEVEKEKRREILINYQEAMATEVAWKHEQAQRRTQSQARVASTGLGKETWWGEIGTSIMKEAKRSLKVKVETEDALEKVAVALEGIADTLEGRLYEPTSSKKAKQRK